MPSARHPTGTDAALDVFDDHVAPLATTAPGGPRADLPASFDALLFVGESGPTRLLDGA